MHSAMRPNAATVLFVGTQDSDRRALANILSHCNWQLRMVDGCPEAWQALHEERVDVVLVDGDAAGGWRDLLAEMHEMLDEPPMILSCTGKNEQLWAEVLNLGGFDVLMKPFESTEVFRTIAFAWRQSRDLIALKRRLAASAEPAAATA